MNQSTSPHVGYSGVTASGVGFTGSAPVPPSTTTVVAGYSGVTATGAGFTGAVPVTVVNSPSSYDAALASAREIVFTEPEGEVVVAPAEDELSRYALEWDIGPTSDEVTAENAMTLLKAQPNGIFPFGVEGLAGEKTIELDKVYNLNSVRWPLDDGNPVLVIQEDPTSFTFLTLPGHFRGEGRTIKFTTLEREGRLILRHDGISGRSVADTINDLGAVHSWRQQADNLRARILGVPTDVESEFVPFPGPPGTVF